MKFVFLGFLLCLTSINLWVQNSEKSALKGYVSDESGAIPGVLLLIKGTSTGTVSATDGSFIVSNIPAGNAVLVASFIGYETQEIALDLQPGLNVIEEIHLASSYKTLQEVIVSGEMAPSQMKAYNMKKLSPGIVDLIASDAIGKLPDRNAAEAVQRISSVAVSRYHGEADRATVRLSRGLRS